MEDLEKLVQKISDFLIKQNSFLATAESCTGGWLSQTLTSIAGSSRWFDRGFVTYSNQSKLEMLDVPEQLIIDCGAVSKEVVIAMANGALKKSEADFSIAITGIAGPDGGSADKPVGLVWFGFASLLHGNFSIQKNFSGDRQQIRWQAVNFAMEQFVQQYLK